MVIRQVAGVVLQRKKTVEEMLNADLEAVNSAVLQERRGPVHPGSSELNSTIGYFKQKQNTCRKPFRWSGIHGENAIFWVSQWHMVGSSYTINIAVLKEKKAFRS